MPTEGKENPGFIKYPPHSCSDLIDHVLPTRFTGGNFVIFINLNQLLQSSLCPSINLFPCEVVISSYLPAVWAFSRCSYLRRFVSVRQWSWFTAKNPLEGVVAVHCAEHVEDELALSFKLVRACRARIS